MYIHRQGIDELPVKKQETFFYLLQVRGILKSNETLLRRWSRTEMFCREKGGNEL